MKKERVIKTKYDQIKKGLPPVVKAELDAYDATKQDMFAGEYKKKRKTYFHAYGFMFFFAAHRFYLGKPWTNVLLWVLLLAYGVGVIWLLIDIIFIPQIIKSKNQQLAKDILIEQKAIRE